MAWSTPRTFAVGEVLTASALNSDLRDNMRELRNRDRARATKAANQSIPNNTVTLVALDTEDYDYGNLYDSAGANPERITIAEAATYAVGFNISWPLNSTGVRFGAIYRNGTALADIVVADRRRSRDDSEAGSSTNIELLAADFVVLQVLQASGAGLDLQANAKSPMLWVHQEGAPV